MASTEDSEDTMSEKASDPDNCASCNNALTSYVVKDDLAYCIQCFEDKFAHVCEGCHKKIATGQKELAYKEKHWHEECFVCNQCKTSLAESPFCCKNDQLLCHTCFSNVFGGRCAKCAQVFKPGAKKMNYKSQDYHYECFACIGCTKPIGTASFYPKNDGVFCVDCYNGTFASKCFKCQQIITSDGINYKDQPWHKECFVCAHCKTTLSGHPFSSKNEQLYCSNCFDDLFAVRCFGCKNAITGAGGAKYVSYEDRNWHNGCFVCAKCNKSLIGEGFLPEGDSIFCGECTRS